MIDLDAMQARADAAVLADVPALVAELRAARKGLERIRSIQDRRKCACHGCIVARDALWAYDKVAGEVAR